MKEVFYTKVTAWESWRFYCVQGSLEGAQFLAVIWDHRLLSVGIALTSCAGHGEALTCPGPALALSLPG